MLFWGSSESFNENSDFADRLLGISDFKFIRDSIIPVVMTMTLARNVVNLLVVRFARFVRLSPTTCFVA